MLYIGREASGDMGYRKRGVRMGVEGDGRTDRRQQDGPTENSNRERLPIGRKRGMWMVTRMEAMRDRNTKEGTKRYVVVKVQIDAFMTKDN